MLKKTTFVTVALLAVVATYGLITNNYSADPATNTLQNTASSVFLPHPALAQTFGGASIADIAEKNIDSIVNISSTRIVKTPEGMTNSPFGSNPFFREFFGPNFNFDIPKERRENSLGSGVIVSADGVIITNNHVVQNADELKINLNDGREFDAEIVGTDPATDVAVIRLKGSNVSGLKPIAFGDSDVMRLGDVVLAIGNPFGLGHTVTMGIVSAKGRSFANRQRITEYEDFIQTDAAINPGNSGGALINMKGELIGINTAIVSGSGGYQGVGFAIPSNMAQTIMNGLLRDGKIVRGWLGVSIQDVTPDIAEAMNLKTNKGAMVSDVLAGGPAEKAGFSSGDVIVKVNDEQIDTANHLRNRIAMLGAEKKVKVTVIRDGRERVLDVTLGERTEEVTLASSGGGGQGSAGSVDGFTVAPIDRNARETYKIPDDIKSGVVVASVEASSAAASVLRVGDVILEANRKQVASVSDFTDTYRKADKSILLYIWRGGGRIFTVINKNE